VRLAILSAFGDAFVRENKDATFRLVAHESRPVLTLIPAPGLDKRPMSYRFIDAVLRLTPNFPKKTWDRLYEKTGARLHLGQLKKTFVILNDEDRHTSGRDFDPASGANALPISASRGRGRGGRGVHVRGGSSASAKRGLDDPGLTTPAKSKRGR